MSKNKITYMKLTETFSISLTKEEFDRIERIRRTEEKIPSRNKIIRELIGIGLKNFKKEVK